MLNGFDDWPLFSRDELNELYLTRIVVDGFADDYYWRSSEYDSWHAWYIEFANHDQFVHIMNTRFRVRADRTF